MERSGVVIVTGSSGLIGSAALRRFAGHGPLAGFDRAGDSRPPAEAECVCVDVTSDESVQAGLARIRYAYGARITSVIHLAAYYNFSGEPSPKYEEVTVRGTERLLRALQGFDVEQFVFSSTMLVHKPSQPGERITEDSPLAPTWAYPKSKVATEEVIRAERGAIPVVLARIAGVYDDRGHSIPIAHQIQRIYERQFESRVFPGDTTRGRQSFVHLADLIDAFGRLIERRHQLPGEAVLLLGESDAMSYEELQDGIACEIFGKEWKTREIPAPMAKAGAWLEDKLPLGKDPFIKPWMISLADDNYELDVTRARAELDWESRHSLRQTLPKIVAALKADPVRWYHENKLELPSSLERSPAQKPPESTRVRNDRKPVAPSGNAAGAAHAMTQMSESKDMSEMKEPGVMMAEHHQMSLWVHPILMAFGAWLIASPPTLGYAGVALKCSDIVSGVLVILFAALSLRGRSWASWANAFVGVWLAFAPLVFWAESSAAYLNDTLIAALLIGFAILIPHGMPMEGPDVPRGWSYNPSTWVQRAPVIALGLIGFLGARYMAAYQLGHIQGAWDPFFGNGTFRVLTSDVSHAWPISDAGLGATVYLFEVLMGLMGDRRRWRTMPWMVTFFGILVIPLGVTSIVLVILQPLAVGAWCTLCLLTALAMLIMIPLTIDEVVAMGQFLAQSHREGKRFWRTFWLGGNVREGAEDARLETFASPVRKMFPAMVWGVSVPWTLIVSAGLGLWLMFAPAVLGTQDHAADSDHLVGALVITFAIIALAEVVRALRFVNVAFGAWLLTAPWFLTGFAPAGRWNDVIAGVALIVLSARRGPIRERYGTWTRFTH